MEPDQEDTQGGLRADGRRASELRQIRMRMGVFGQADGSAYIEHGNTKVLAAVYGPHQVSINYYKVFILLIIVNILIIICTFCQLKIKTNIYFKNHISCIRNITMRTEIMKIKIMSQ